MTQNDGPTGRAYDESSSQTAGSKGGRDLVLGLIALLLFAGLSFGALTLLGSTNGEPPPLAGANLPSGEKPIDLTLVHTNDTWGYLHGCG